MWNCDVQVQRNILVPPSVSCDITGHGIHHVVRVFQLQLSLAFYACLCHVLRRFPSRIHNVSVSIPRMWMSVILQESLVWYILFSWSVSTVVVSLSAIIQKAFNHNSWMKRGAFSSQVHIYSFRTKFTIITLYIWGYGNFIYSKLKSAEHNILQLFRLINQM